MGDEGQRPAHIAVQDRIGETAEDQLAMPGMLRVFPGKGVISIARDRPLVRVDGDADRVTPHQAQQQRQCDQLRPYLVIGLKLRKLSYKLRNPDFSRADGALGDATDGFHRVLDRERNGFGSPAEQRAVALRAQAMAPRCCSRRTFGRTCVEAPPVRGPRSRVMDGWRRTRPASVLAGCCSLGAGPAIFSAYPLAGT